ncbi:hypothetical protein MKW94_024421 [Papaver nudicaule]|uniref:N-acetyltransferase domain-containing protein n=1 Tax=Papaver nudicaule TaxID=74823 RepID=A0AA41RZY1_PAPNU|nr:hypothetical protein [Papaver nudicaule]
MVDIRQGTLSDLPGIQACESLCFPVENHPGDYLNYEDYLVLWPQLVYVAEDRGTTGRILGFVVAKTLEEDRHGYISYLGVRPTHRGQGIAKKLMTAAQNAMVQEYGSEYVTLHVRRNSKAAINLFKKVHGYKFCQIAPEFYDNREDAYVMTKQLLQRKEPDHSIMVCIRKATLADIPEIKACELLCFPDKDLEKYPSFFNDNILSPLGVVYVAEYSGRIVEDEEEPEEADDNEEECQEGYISWLGVHPTYRKLGIAAKLMTAAENAMMQEYGCEYVELKVRVSNHAGVILYTRILGYRFHRNDVSDDGEDAYIMRKQLPGKQLDHLMLGFRHGSGCFWSEANAEWLGLLDRLEIC